VLREVLVDPEGASVAAVPALCARHAQMSCRFFSALGPTHSSFDDLAQLLAELAHEPQHHRAVQLLQVHAPRVHAGAPDHGRLHEPAEPIVGPDVPEAGVAVPFKLPASTWLIRVAEVERATGADVQVLVAPGHPRPTRVVATRVDDDADLVQPGATAVAILLPAVRATTRVRCGHHGSSLLRCCSRRTRQPAAADEASPAHGSMLRTWGGPLAQLGWRRWIRRSRATARALCASCAASSGLLSSPSTTTRRRNNIPRRSYAACG